MSWKQKQKETNSVKLILCQVRQTTTELLVKTSIYAKQFIWNKLAEVSLWWHHYPGDVTTSMTSCTSYNVCCKDLLSRNLPHTLLNALYLEKYVPNAIKFHTDVALTSAYILLWPASKLYTAVLSLWRTLLPQPVESLMSWERNSSGFMKFSKLANFLTYEKRSCYSNFRKRCGKNISLFQFSLINFTFHLKETYLNIMLNHKHNYRIESVCRMALISWEHHKDAMLRLYLPAFNGQT